MTLTQHEFLRWSTQHVMLANRQERQVPAQSSVFLHQRRYGQRLWEPSASSTAFAAAVCRFGRRFGGSGLAKLTFLRFATWHFLFKVSVSRCCCQRSWSSRPFARHCWRLCCLLLLRAPRPPRRRRRCPEGNQKGNEQNVPAGSWWTWLLASAKAFSLASRFLFS